MLRFPDSAGHAQAGGYEALCAQAGESILATAAVAATSELYQRERGESVEQLVLEPALVAVLVECLSRALAAGSLRYDHPELQVSTPAHAKHPGGMLIWGPGGCRVTVDGVADVSVADLMVALAGLTSR